MVRRTSILRGLSIVLMFVLWTSGCTAPGAGYNQQGMTAFRAGDYAAALGYFQRSAQLYPGDPDVYYNIGMTHHRLGQSDQARRNYSMCLSHDASHAKCHHALVVLLMEQGREQQAMDHVNRWVDGAPANPDALVELAWMERQLDDDIQARDTLQQALALSPMHARGLAELASIYEAENRPDRALALYNRALRSDPGNVQLAERASGLRGDSTQTASRRDRIATSSDLRRTQRR